MSLASRIAAVYTASGALAVLKSNPYRLVTDVRCVYVCMCMWVFVCVSVCVCVCVCGNVCDAVPGCCLVPASAVIVSFVRTGVWDFTVSTRSR